MTDREKQIEALLEEYKTTCMGFARESQHKGNGDNTKFWSNKAKQIDALLREDKPCPESQEPAESEFVEKGRKYCKAVISYAHFVKGNATEEKKEEITKKLYELLFSGFNIVESLCDRLDAANIDLSAAKTELSNYEAVVNGLTERAEAAEKKLAFKYTHDTFYRSECERDELKVKLRAAEKHMRNMPREYYEIEEENKQLQATNKAIALELEAEKKR